MPNAPFLLRSPRGQTSRGLRPIVGATLATLLATAGASLAAAQIPRDTVAPPVITSMGQPKLWQPYTSVVATFGRNNDATGGVELGIFRPKGSPVNGVFGLAAEGYLFAADGGPTGGARLLGVTKAINLGYGIDWDAKENNFAFMLSFNTAVRRGGIFGHGTMLRVDWIPPRGSGLDVGVTVPLGQRYAGRTRPHDTGISLREVARAATPRATASTANGDAFRGAPATPLAPSADTALRRVREAALLIAGYMNFFSEQHEIDSKKDDEKTRAIARRVRNQMALVSPDYPEGRTFVAAEHAYTASLEGAFAIAVRDRTLGAKVARRAREGLLTNMLIPYDALFGRVKDDQYDLSPLVNAVQADFRMWLTDSLGISNDARLAAMHVHDAWMAAIRAVHERISKQWDDSRRVWLPLQLALTPEEHDDQVEIDALVARVIGRPFTRGNQVTYLNEDRIQLEIARSIYSARNYHVLWVHDYAGTRSSGSVDRIGYAQTANVYFPALTQAVARFDSTGELTTFMLILDQNFYEPNNGRLWMTILEDPLGAEIKLPGKGSAKDSLETTLRGRQGELRAAVAKSRRLQALAAKYGGNDWLRRTVKVHVSITQPSDFTYRSHRIIAGVPLLPDNLMRDHRKIAFYDVTESAPFKGGMVLSGVGVGEHYATPTWEDRGVLVRGPGVLEVRAAARRLLKLNSFSNGEIPLPLRETLPCDTCAYAATDGAAGAASELGRVLQVHNEPGFGRKQATIARAMLYTLAPRGSVLVVPDGLWLESGWAGMLAGAALRGCRVYIVGPALANAPSAGFPQMSRTHDVLLRLLQVRQEFQQEIQRAGGELRIGLYTAKEDVNDIAQQARATNAGVARYPWLRQLFPFDSSVIALYDSAPAVLERAGYKPFVLGRDETPRLPQLHRKTQFFADSAALVQLTSRPEWREVAIQAIIARAEQARRGVKTGLYDDTLSTAAHAAVSKLLRGYFESRPTADSARMTFYYTVGTQNEDPRGMLLDGEAVFVMSGVTAAGGLVDLYSLMARSTWIETEDDLNQLIPPYKTWQRRLGRFARLVL